MNYVKTLGTTITLCLTLSFLFGCERLHDSPPHHAPIRVVQAPSHQGYSIDWFDLGDVKTDRAVRHANADEVIKLGRPSVWGMDVIRNFLRTMKKLNPKDPFWGVRLALFELQVMRDRQGLTNAMTIAKDFSRDFPKDPDAVFLRGYVSWFALAQRMVSPQSAVGQDLIKMTLQSFSDLLTLAPKYRGPGGVDVAWIKLQNEGLQKRFSTTSPVKH